MNRGDVPLGTSRWAGTTLETMAIHDEPRRLAGEGAISTVLPPVLPTSVDFTDPVEAELALRIATAWRELRRGAATQRLREYFLDGETLDQGQLDTLDVLVTRSAWKMSEIAEALRVDPSTATRAVQRLVDIGLAQRAPSNRDARVVMVAASEEGLRRQRSILSRRVIAMSRILGGYEPGERAVLATVLEGFIGRIDELVADLAAAETDPDPS
jgi:DNA-binding MarR family transcriptional regulator